MRTIAIIAVSIFAGSPAGAMSVADLLSKADALQAKGMMALFSSDFRLVKADVISGFKAWHAQITPPGRPPNACPPQGDQKMSSDEILAMLKAVPVAQRGATSTADALVAALNRRFPCRS